MLRRRSAPLLKPEQNQYVAMVTHQWRLKNDTRFRRIRFLSGHWLGNIESVTVEDNVRLKTLGTEGDGVAGCVTSR